MPAWNPSSGINTLEQAYKFGETDARRRIASWIESLPEDLPRKELAERVRIAEYAIAEPVVAEKVEP